MPQKTLKLLDLMGPYKGQVRTYLEHAGLNAIDSGFARYPDPEVDVGAGAIPPDFPSRDLLVKAGITRLADVPDDLDALTALPKIGEGRAHAILDALERGTPEPEPELQPEPED